MPFGLKNAGATYQRLVDKIFKPHIGHIMEVYVDDIVIKSKEKATSIADLRTVLGLLQKVNLKLNPQKCTFAVRSGKFLGCWVSQDGLKANLSKVQTILDMTMPKSIHDVHKLTGCIAALSRFLSKATEKQLPFFKILKKASEFSWESEHKSAFEALKNYLVKLPTLSVPKAGEVLSLYLTTSDETISAVLVCEEGRRQLLVYFINRALKGPKTRYQPIEKLALALVNAARRLQPYFHAHPIQVLTNHPLQQVLTKPEASGRIVKSAIELGKHDISYCPRQAIKGQALADFLAETNFVEKPKLIEPTSDSVEDKSTDDVPLDCWQVFVDGASGKAESGAGILFIGPSG